MHSQAFSPVNLSVVSFFQTHPESPEVQENFPPLQVVWTGPRVRSEEEGASLSKWAWKLVEILIGQPGSLPPRPLHHTHQSILSCIGLGLRGSPALTTLAETRVGLLREGRMDTGEANKRCPVCYEKNVSRRVLPPIQPARSALFLQTKGEWIT